MDVLSGICSWRCSSTKKNKDEMRVMVKRKEICRGLGREGVGDARGGVHVLSIVHSREGF